MSWAAERDDPANDQPRSSGSGLRAAEGRYRTGHDLAEARARAFDRLGGFYYSVGAFKCVETPSAMQTGIARSSGALPDIGSSVRRTSSSGH